MSDPLVLAYLAGIIDADGYITINRSVRGKYIYHAPQIGISGTRRAPHDLAASIWGGNIGLYQPSKAGYRGQYQWSRQGLSAVAPIEQLRPYLRIKVEQADLAIVLWEHRENARCDDPFPWFGPDYDPVEEADRLREEMIALNCSRTRLRRAAGRLLDGVTHDGFPA